MPKYIIHHKGVFNQYTTVADGPCWESGLTRDQISKFRGVDEERISRAEKKGTSSYINTDMRDTVFLFLENEGITIEQFIGKYMTIREV